MNGPIGYVHKRRQRKLAMWTEGARQYLKLRMSQPTRSGKPPYLFVEPAIIDEFMDKLRHSSGFGNSARLAIHQSFTGELMELMRRKNRTAAIVRRAARIPQAVLAEIRALDGKAQVAWGSSVTEGQLLISGVVDTLVVKNTVSASACS